MKTFREILEAKFKDQLIEEYEVVIRSGFKEIIANVSLPASTGRWVMSGESVRKIQDTFDTELKRNYWTKRDVMVSTLKKLTKADEIEVNRVK